jgi:hypothetical protein
MPHALPDMMALAETYFRKHHELSPKADLKEAGFRFPNNRFELNCSFGLTDRMILFYFNTYDIAPNVYGPTKIEIPLSHVRSLVRPIFLQQ